MTKKTIKKLPGFFPTAVATRYNKDSLIHHVKALDHKKYDLYRDGIKWTRKEYSLILEKFLTQSKTIVSLVAETHRSRDAIGTKLRKLCYCYRGAIEIKDISRNRSDRTGAPLTPHDRYCMAMATGPTGRKYGAIVGDTDYLGAVLGRSPQDALSCLHKILDERDRVNKGGFFATAKNRTKWMKLHRLVREVSSYLNGEVEGILESYMAWQEARQEIDNLVARGAVRLEEKRMIWL